MSSHFTAPVGTASGPGVARRLPPEGCAIEAEEKSSAFFLPKSCS